MLLRPSRLAVAVARTDHNNVLVLRNELNEHIRPGMLVWGVSKFSAEKNMKEQPSFYAFFIRKIVAPTGDTKEVVVEGEWLHALKYLRRLDKNNVIGDKWQCHNVWFFTKQRQNLEADSVVSVVSAVPVRVSADGVLIDARSGVEVPSWMTGSTLDNITDSQPTPDNEVLGQESILLAGKATLEFDNRKRKRAKADMPKSLTAIADFDTLPLDFSVADFEPGFMAPRCPWGPAPDDEIEQRSVGFIPSGQHADAPIKMVSAPCHPAPAPIHHRLRRRVGPLPRRASASHTSTRRRRGHAWATSSDKMPRSAW